MKKQIALAALLLCLVAAPSFAQTRTWTKDHVTMEIAPGDPLLGEYSKIQTSDGLSPELTRVLFQDKFQKRLIYRKEKVLDGANSVLVFKLEFPTSGESMEISVSIDGSGVFSSGGNTVPFSDDDAETNLPTSVTSAALAIFTALSADFKSATIEFVKAGRMLSDELDVGTYSFARMLFPSLQGMAVSNDLTIPGNHISDFDPQVDPPTAFEVPFGSAYYN